MHRTLVAPSAIEAWLTEQLRTLEDCQDCAVSGVMALQEPDDQGCNWSDSLTVNCGGVPYQYYGPHLQALILRARKQFNLV